MSSDFISESQDYSAGTAGDCEREGHRPTEEVLRAIAQGRILGGYAECSGCGCGFWLGDFIPGKR